MNINIDTLSEIIAAGIIILIAISIILWAILSVLKKGRIKIGKTEVIGSKVKLHGELDMPCVPYVEEHSTILRRLENGQKNILGSLDYIGNLINEIDSIQGTMITGQKIILKKMRNELGRDNEELNGDLDEAWDENNRAEVRYKERRKVI
jgi:hypothetical protein